MSEYRWTRLAQRVPTLLIAAAVFGTSPLMADNAASFEQHIRNGTVHVTVKAPVAGGVGWQSYFKYVPPKGYNLLFTDTCPDVAPVPVNGAFNTNSAAKAGLSLVANYRPTGEGAASWSWSMNWPAGAPANSLISFSVYCVK